MRKLYEGYMIKEKVDDLQQILDSKNDIQASSDNLHDSDINSKSNIDVDTHIFAEAKKRTQVSNSKYRKLTATEIEIYQYVIDRSIDLEAII